MDSSKSMPQVVKTSNKQCHGCAKVIVIIDVLLSLRTDVVFFYYRERRFLLNIRILNIDLNKTRIILKEILKNGRKDTGPDSEAIHKDLRKDIGDELDLEYYKITLRNLEENGLIENRS